MTRTHILSENKKRKTYTLHYITLFIHLLRQEDSIKNTQVYLLLFTCGNL